MTFTYFVTVNNFLENTFREFKVKDKEKAVQIYLSETGESFLQKLSNYTEKQIKDMGNLMLASNNDGYKRVVLSFIRDKGKN